MQTYPFEVNPIAGALGAEIAGVDLAEALDEALIGALRQALLSYHVIFFRDQDMTPADQIRFSRYFGELDIYPFVRGLEDYPEIIEVKKTEAETVNFGGLWHTDTPYLATPSLGSILVARELPAFGGDTEFANTRLAYEALSDGMKRLLVGLKAVNSAGKGAVVATRTHRAADNGSAQQEDEKSALHPIVRTHPETGLKSLYCSPGHVTRIDGLNEAESQPILNYLFRHQIRPEFTCRFRWSEGAVAFWDNRASMHNPLNDYHGQRRLLHRTTLKGDRPT